MSAPKHDSLVMMTTIDEQQQKMSTSCSASSVSPSSASSCSTTSTITFYCKICFNKFRRSSSSFSSSSPSPQSSKHSTLMSISTSFSSGSSTSSSSPAPSTNSIVSPLLLKNTSHHQHCCDSVLIEDEEMLMDDGSDNSMFQIKSCKCQFCRRCLNLYIKECISSFNVMPVSCPDLKCMYKGFLAPDEIKLLLSSEPSALYDKYLKLCENIEILRDPSKKHCPQANCQNVCRTGSSSTSSPSRVTCDKCLFEFCSVCSKKWNPSLADFNKIEPAVESEICSCSKLIITAPAAAVTTPDNLTSFLKSYATNLEATTSKMAAAAAANCTALENIKRCPKCAILIERAEGCAQVMCKMCRHTFCFYCLASLDNDFFLKHYTKNGPCKGKLGHSRFTLFLHRASVVAIFGGTVVLIVLLSPLILLSLPCLFFSNRCRNTCQKLTNKFTK